MMSSPAAKQSRESPPSTVFILGDFIHEGLKAKIEALGFQAVMMNLKTGPKHWKRVAASMRELNDRSALVAAFGYLPTPTLLRIGDPKYEESLSMLVTELERTTSLLFLYEQNLEGTIEPLPWECQTPRYESPVSEFYTQFLADFPEMAPDVWARPNRLPTREEWITENTDRVRRAQLVVEKLLASAIELVPFTRRNEVTIRIFEVLDDRESGVFLRVYVPHGRYQGEQFQGFLDLFSRYFREVENREFAIDAQRTRRGTTYVFRSRDEPGSVSDLREAMQRFDEFMALAQADPERAEGILTREGVNIDHARTLITRYGRSYRRLLLDARHELEQKQLMLRQHMESDLLEVREMPLLPQVQPDHPSSLLQIVGNTGSVSLNLSGAIVNLGPSSTAFVGQLVDGNVEYTSQDRQILNLIANLEDDVEALRLRSELEILKDEATPADTKETSAQKLKAFLYKAARATGKKVSEVGTSVLVAYLESMVTGKSGTG